MGSGAIGRRSTDLCTVVRVSERSTGKDAGGKKTGGAGPKDDSRLWLVGFGCSGWGGIWGEGNKKAPLNSGGGYDLKRGGGGGGLGDVRLSRRISSANKVGGASLPFKEGKPRPLC